MEPVHGRYVLKHRSLSGAVEVLPVRSRAVPFDVDLGRVRGER